MKFSEEIESILKIFEKCKTDSKLYETKLKNAENEEKDILHKFIGIDEYKEPPPNYKQRALLGTQLQKVLLDRREAKDCIKLYQPLLEFINSETGTKAINMLKMSLGDTRKIENGMSVRRYYKRARKT
jgi:hypothetical protein